MRERCECLGHVSDLLAKAGPVEWYSAGLWPQRCRIIAGEGSMKGTCGVVYSGDTDVTLERHWLQGTGEMSGVRYAYMWHVFLLYAVV